MIIKSGDVCLINIFTNNGYKRVKGILVEKNRNTCHWLLVIFPKAEIERGFKLLVMTTRDNRYSEIGYSYINHGNYRSTTVDAAICKLGFISYQQLIDVYYDLFMTKRSWYSPKHQVNRPTGNKFWINLNPYVGVRIPGMSRRGGDDE